MICPDCGGQLEYTPPPPAQNGRAFDGHRASGAVSSDSGLSRHPCHPRQNMRTTR